MSKLALVLFFLLGFLFSAQAQNDRTVYAIAREANHTAYGLYISENGGPFTRKPSVIDSLLSSCNSALMVRALNQNIYLASECGLAISNDGGASFSLRTTAHGLASNKITGLLVTPTMIVAATTKGLSLSTDGGKAFSIRTTDHGLGDNFVRDVGGDDSRIHAATGNGVSISTDGGESFTFSPVSTGPVTSVAVRSRFILAGGDQALFHSHPSPNAAPKASRNFWSFSRDFGLGSLSTVRRVLATGSADLPFMPTIFAATEEGIVVGRPALAGPTNENQWHFSRALEKISINDLSTADNSNIYVASENGIFHSPDNGKTFLGVAAHLMTKSIHASISPGPGKLTPSKAPARAEAQSKLAEYVASFILQNLSLLLSPDSAPLR